ALDFSKARDLAKGKAGERCNDPMLLSWHNGKTGEFYPRFECGSGDKPPWIVFAEARGGNLTIDINDGEYIFIYLKL
ncbi:MAG: AF1514 family protein, partial [Proteobacteria bacterium]|nr:AF1514 family protein [Pseudomonadota bacterium]MBU4504433.1 AF1514 family protein [Pseudomonadota bacterium]